MFFNERIKSLSDWDELLLDTEYALNISSNITTKAFFYLLFYGVHPRSEINLNLIINTDAEQFFQDRRKIREKVADCLKLT
jgi:hypothetical protein